MGKLNRIKRLGRIALAALCVFGSLTGVVSASGGFVDVQEGDYFYRPVSWAVENGITSGIGDDRFGPFEACTRGQVVTFLWRVAGSPEPEQTENPFSDVQSDDYFYTPVQWAAAEGITAGVSESSFGPYDTCTRGQIVTFLWKFRNALEPESLNTQFTDVDLSAYYAKPVAWAVENGITAGVEENAFAPGDTCTRGQIVTFLYKTEHLGSDITVPPSGVPAVSTIVYGTSGAGRNLVAYRYGNGKNVMIVTFAIHGWEDAFSRDGQLLVNAADKLRATLQEQVDTLIRQGQWSVYVIPCLNPDGLADGWTNNGPGRCTTTPGKGIDMNRCFPYNFVPSYNSRTYTGDSPLQSVEAKALYEFVKKCRGRDHNILIDVHGWYEQILCSTNQNGQVYRALKEAFPSCSYTTLRGGRGYFSAWAGYLQGFEACLFEYPYIRKADDFYRWKYDQRLTNAICQILRTYH